MSADSILLVEDEPEIREMLSFSLVRAGFEVIEADSAETALARAEQAAAAAIGGELVAADLRDAVAHLEEIVGIVASDDVLNRIFAQFCIGK